MSEGAGGGPTNRHGMARRPYRFLLRLYPRPFRERYGVEMIRDLDAALAAERARRGRVGARVWVAIGCDAVVQGLAERRTARHARSAAGRTWPRRGSGLDGLRQDFAAAGRSLARRPWFTLVAALTLALGIGANAAILSVAWQVLLKPLPFPDERRLVMVWETWRDRNIINPVSPFNFSNWKTRSRSFEALAAFNRYAGPMNLTGAGEPVQVDVGFVTDTFFDLLGVRPLAGRTFQAGDRQSDGLAMLGEGLWRRRFGADPAVVGRPIRLDGSTCLVIGVAPDEVTMAARPADAWLLQHIPEADQGGRFAHYLNVVARLRPGVTLAQANADVSAVASWMAAEFPDSNEGLGAKVVDLRAQLTGRARPTIVVLAGGAALLLLIAGANLTGLLLARQAGRSHEMAVRAAIGASRSRLVRQLLAEGLALSLTGGAAGLLLGSWALAAMAHLAPALAGLRVQTLPDGVVVGCVLVLSIVSGVAFALVPALRAASPRLREALATRGGWDASSSGLRTAFVGVQVALAVVLLVGAALLVTSLVRVLHVDPGFHLDRGLVADVALPPGQYPDPAARARFFDQAIAQVEALPGVERACALSRVPLGGTPASMTFVPEGTTHAVGSLPFSATRGCFETLGMPLLRGRRFMRAEPAPVAVVSASMAQQLWPDEDPLGKRMHLGIPTGDLYTVVGVVGDIHSVALEGDSPRQVWVPAQFGVFPPGHLVVRTALAPATLASSVRDAVRSLDRNLPVANIRTMADVTAKTLEERRFTLLLLGSFAAVALVLCAVGIHGLLAQLVAQRTREIGVRVALGAPPRQVVGLVVGGSAAAVTGGSLAGLAAAWTFSRLMRHMLFEVSPTSPGLFAGVALLVAIVAVLAAVVPARRATRVDPIVALRTD